MCFGTTLKSLEEAHVNVVREGARAREETSISGHDSIIHVSSSFSPGGSTFFSHLNTISSTSKIILYAASIVALSSMISAFIVDWYTAWQRVLVLMLVFVQPVLILYYVYWKRRKDVVMLDYVIKMFAVGFWYVSL
jgi:hypothetical protein